MAVQCGNWGGTLSFDFLISTFALAFGYGYTAVEHK